MSLEERRSALRVLGIDPGSVITGWGIVEKQASRLVHVDNGGIFTRNKDFHQRLVEIFDGLQEVIETYQPEVVSMERVFVSRNPQSALKLGHARGVASIVALKAGLKIYEYTPMQIKLAVVGHGRASKEQVAHMVMAMLGLPEPAQVDASDALGAAICHHLQPDEAAAALEVGLPNAQQLLSQGSSRRSSKKSRRLTEQELLAHLASK